jgi:hypothetical protein
MIVADHPMSVLAPAIAVFKIGHTIVALLEAAVDSGPAVLDAHSLTG